MKAFDLIMALKRVPPDTDVLISHAVPGGHGAFAHATSGMSQDRTVRDGETDRPVFVLHASNTDKVWAAREHGKPSPFPGAVNVYAKNRDGMAGWIVMYDRIQPVGAYEADDCLTDVVGDGATTYAPWARAVFVSVAVAEGWCSRNRHEVVRFENVAPRADE